MSDIPHDRPAGSPLARRFGATDRGDRLAAATEEFVARRFGSRVTKSGTVQVAVFDQSGRLLGYVDEKKILPLGQPSVASSDEEVAKALATLKAATAENQQRLAERQAVRKSAAGRVLNAVILVEALGWHSSRNAVRKDSAPIQAGEYLRFGALVRTKLSPAGRQRFDQLLARTTMASRHELSRRLKAL